MFTNCGLQLNPSENSFHILLWNLPSSSCSQFPGFSCRSFIPSFRHLYKKLCCGWCCWQNLLFSVQWLGFVSWKFRKTTWKDKAALLFCEENKQRLFIIPTGSAPSPDDKLCRHTASPLMRNHLLGKRVCMSNVWSTAGFLQVRDWPGQTPPVCVEAAGRWNKQPLLLLPLDKGKQFCTPPFYFSDFDKAVNKRNKAGIRNAPNPPPPQKWREKALPTSLGGAARFCHSAAICLMRDRWALAPRMDGWSDGWIQVFALETKSPAWTYLWAWEQGWARSFTFPWAPPALIRTPLAGVRASGNIWGVAGVPFSSGFHFSLGRRCQLSSILFFFAP